MDGPRTGWMQRTAAAVLFLVAAAVTGCTWVDVSDAGRNVVVLEASAAAGCEKIGRVSSHTRERVLTFPRSERDVREELEALSRNEAAQMGGNAIVPIEAPTNGRQSFEVYRCPTP